MTTKYNSIRDISDDMYIHNTNKLNTIIKKFINKHPVKYYLDIASKSYESTTENIAAEIWADYLREDPDYSTLFDKKIEILSTQFSKFDIINMYQVLDLELPDDTSVANLRRHFDDVYYEFLNQADYNLVDTIDYDIELEIIVQLTNMLEKYI